MQTQEFGMTSKTTPEQEKQKQKNKKKCRDKRAFSKLQLATQRNSNCIYFPSLNNCYQKNEKNKKRNNQTNFAMAFCQTTPTGYHASQLSMHKHCQNPHQLFLINLRDSFCHPALYKWAAECASNTKGGGKGEDGRKRFLVFVERI